MKRCEPVTTLIIGCRAMNQSAFRALPWRDIKSESGFGGVIMMKKTLFVTVAALAIGVISAQAAMRPAPLPPIRPVSLDVSMQQAGTLSCMVQRGFGMIVGSTRTATCIFDHPGENSYSQTYEAQLSRVGLDVGVMPKQAMRWAVFTPGGVAEPGMLEGVHTGASAEAAIGVGDGGKVAFQDNTGRQIIFQQMNAPMAIGVSFGFGTANLDLAAPSAPVFNQ